jgi:hypothetical protein
MPKTLQKFFKAENTEVYHLGCGHWKQRVVQKNDTFVPISDELAKKALELVLDKRNHPVMVMCKTGVHQSATLIACLRRVLNWGMTAIFYEYDMLAANLRTQIAGILTTLPPPLLALCPLFSFPSPPPSLAPPFPRSLPTSDSSPPLLRLPLLLLNSF